MTSTNPRSFKTIREEWNDFKLKDGAIIRIKILLSFLDEGGQGKGSIALSHVVSAWAPSDLRRKEKAGPILPPSELEKAIDEDNLGYERLAEGPSEYEAGQQRFTIRTRPERFARSKHFGPDGTPQYLVRHAVEVVGEVPFSMLAGLPASLPGARKRKASPKKAATRQKSRA